MARRSGCRIRDLRNQEPTGPYRTEPEDRRGCFDIFVDIAGVQGGKTLKDA